MTTGMIDLMISSGLRTATEQMPTPDFAVPYAAPALYLSLANFRDTVDGVINLSTTWGH